VKICPGDECGPFSWTATALQYIEKNRLQYPAVASMSVGGMGRSPSLSNAITHAVRVGITVVVAAGNNGVDACRVIPASIPAAITVGGSNKDDEFYWQFPGSQSNWGRCVDIIAPAVDIVSASHTSVNGAATMTGTSMACPHVSGAAALLKKWYRDPTAVLLATATRNKIRTGNAPRMYGTVNRLLYVQR